MKPPARSTAVLPLGLLLAAASVAGCDRTGLEGESPTALDVGLSGTYAGRLASPDARFFSDALPDRPCREASLSLDFDAAAFELRCEVVDGIVRVEYEDRGPMRAERDGTRITAQNERGFVFQGLLGPDEAQIAGELRGLASAQIGVTVGKQR